MVTTLVCSRGHGHEDSENISLVTLRALYLEALVTKTDLQNCLLYANSFKGLLRQ